MRGPVIAALTLVASTAAAGSPDTVRTVWCRGVDEAEDSVSVALDACSEGRRCRAYVSSWSEPGSATSVHAPRSRRERGRVTDYVAQRDDPTSYLLAIRARFVDGELRRFRARFRPAQTRVPGMPRRLGMADVVRVDEV